MSKINRIYFLDKTSIYLCKNKLGKIKDIANMIRDKSSEFYDWEAHNNRSIRRFCSILENRRFKRVFLETEPL